jgi:hypothetical protein
MLAAMPRRLLTLGACALVVAIMAAPSSRATAPRPTPRPPVVVEVRRDGFHWGDAAIGVAAALGVGLAASGVRALRRAAVHTNGDAERNSS